MSPKLLGKRVIVPDSVSHSLSLKNGINTFVVMRGLNYSGTPGVLAAGIAGYITTSRSSVGTLMIWGDLTAVEMSDGDTLEFIEASKSRKPPHQRRKSLHHQSDFRPNTVTELIVLFWLFWTQSSSLFVWSFLLWLLLLSLCPVYCNFVVFNSAAQLRHKLPLNSVFKTQ